jgi:hypothetical protein
MAPMKDEWELASTLKRLLLPEGENGGQGF